MELKDLRNEIDLLDKELVVAFVKRMECAAQIAAEKKANNLPISVPERELAVLQAVKSQAPVPLQEAVGELYATIFKLSKDYQNTLL